MASTVNNTHVPLDDEWTYIAALVDTSGSMAAINPSNTAKELTKLIKEQKGTKVTTTLATFSTKYKIIKKNIDAKDFSVSIEEIYPTGSTAIQESFCKLIDDVGKELSEMTDKRPGKIIFIILTDGEENASTEQYAGINGLNLLREKITHQQSVYNWFFYLLAANMDAVLLGKKYGIPEGFCISYYYSQFGCSNVMGSASAAINRLISIPSCDLNQNKERYVQTMSFTQEERFNSIKPDEH